MDTAPEFTGESKLEAKISEAVSVLEEQGATVATAESCTGGLVAAYLTHKPGSSAVFLGGVVAYANDAKAALLGVDEALLRRHGAVSEPVAKAMAEGVRRRLGATYAVSLTGIAGPGGGTEAKPVGTVFCAVAAPQGTKVVEWHLDGDRAAIRQAAALGALDELIQTVRCGEP